MWCFIVPGELNSIIKEVFFMKKTKKVYRALVRLSLMIATIVAMLFVSVNVSKITVTQFRLGMIYRDIEAAESSREYAASQAQSHNGGTTKYYQSQADSADEEIEYLLQKRYDIQHSDDSLVAWAAKDGFEISIFLLSTGALISIIGVWYLVFKNLTVLIDIEEKICNKILFLVFTLLSCAFFFVGRVCHGIALINYRRKKKNKKNCKSRTSNIIELDKKRRRLG